MTSNHEISKDPHQETGDEKLARWTREGAQNWQQIKAEEEELLAYQQKIRALTELRASIMEEEAALKCSLETQKPDTQAVQGDSHAEHSKIQVVTISGVDIPFWSLVRNLVMLSLAAIPALMILFLAAQIFFGLMIAKGLSIFFH
jgi:hypothetical protein